MQANIERGNAALGVRSVGRFAILAGVPLIATLALSGADRASAACLASHPAGVHTGVGGSAHAATAHPASGGGGGGGGGSLGCAGGSSASALGHLATASSGRVVDNVAHTAAHTRTATTRTANTSLHSRVARPQHRV